MIDNLCKDIILGTDFQELHESIVINYGGSKPALTFSALTAMKTHPPSLFSHLTADCKPITTHSRNYSQSDRDYIKNEIQNFHKAGIIEPSNSPWRAQVLVVKDKSKRRMVVDYSQTINEYTQLDAYPLPKIDEMVNEIAKFKVFSTIDLRRAYYQIPLSEEDRQDTAFEADGKLWQFTRMPFGITNGVPRSLGNMDEFITKHNLPDCFAFLDNVTICGMSQEEHDRNLKLFRTAAEADGLTFNEDKCFFAMTSIELLGYRISSGSLQPDPERLRPLLDSPTPHDQKLLKIIVGIFAYYAKIG